MQWNSGHRVATILVLVLAGAGCAATGADKPEDWLGVSTARIVGGTATSIEAHPHQISLQGTRWSHFCGGSVLSGRWVLTAAHCVEGESASDLLVVAGVTRQSQSRSGGQQRTVRSVTVYPSYVSSEQGGDIALLELSSPLDLTSSAVSAIPLVTESAAASGVTDPDRLGTVSGWGTLSEEGSSPDQLRAVQIPLVSNALAESAYRRSFGDEQIGAGVMGVGGRDSCQGDSGGPLTVDTPNGRALAGVVSWGAGCGDARYPGMYARVSHFADWILAHTDGVTGIDDSAPAELPPEPAAPAGSLDEQDLSAERGDWFHYELAVPSGATGVTVTTSGGLGDGDLYVRTAGPPALGLYDCRPYRNGNEESCELTGVSGIVYVGVHAYASFSGLDLTASFESATATAPSALLEQTGISAPQGEWRGFVVDVPAGRTALVTLTGGNGDADLYVRYGSEPDLGTYDCRSWSIASNESCGGLRAGRAYVGVHAYQGFSAATLTVAVE